MFVTKQYCFGGDSSYPNYYYPTLKVKVKNPSSLLRFCAIRICRCIHGNVAEAVTELQLPRSLRDLLIGISFWDLLQVSH